MLSHVESLDSVRKGKIDYVTLLTSELGPYILYNRIGYNRCDGDP